MKYVHFLIRARLDNGRQSGDKSGVVYFLLILLLSLVASHFCTIIVCVFSIHCLTEGLSLHCPLALCCPKMLQLGLD